MFQCHAIRASNEEQGGHLTRILTGETVAKLYPAVASAPLAPRGFVADILDDLRRIAASDGQFSVAAHCLCEVR